MLQGHLRRRRIIKKVRSSIALAPVSTSHTLLLVSGTNTLAYFAAAHWQFTTFFYCLPQKNRTNTLSYFARASLQHNKPERFITFAPVCTSHTLFLVYFGTASSTKMTFLQHLRLLFCTLPRVNRTISATLWQNKLHLLHSSSSKRNNHPNLFWWSFTMMTFFITFTPTILLHSYSDKRDNHRKKK